MPTSDMKHLLYKTTCHVTGKFYLGMHSTENENDNYLGSGLLIKRSIKAHGRSAHTREILQSFLNRDDLARAEKAIIQEHIHDTNCLNLVEGGEGGNKIIWSLERRKKQSMISAAMERTKLHCSNIAEALTGKSQTDDRKSKISAALSGRKLAAEHIERSSKSRTGKSQYLWELKAPDGTIIFVESLHTFCKEKGFKYLSLYKSLNRPICRGSAKGWSLSSKPILVRSTKV